MNEPDDHEHLNAMKRHALLRQRRYWMWIAFLPGLLAPIGFFLWIGAIMDAAYSRSGGDWATLVIVVYCLVTLGWNVYCAIKLTPLAEKPDLSSSGITVLLALGNTALGAGLIWGACAVMG